MNIVHMPKITRVLASALFALVLVAAPQGASAQATDTFCYNFTTDLTIGSTGADVIALQIALLKDGQKTVTSGNFGTQTQAAVVAFQTKHGISPAAGYVGPLTRTKLAELYGCGTSTAPRGTIMATVEGTSAFASDGGTITVPPTTNAYTGTLLSIAWSAKNVTACSVNNVGGQFFGGAGVIGSKTWGPKQSTTLQLRCFTDPDGEAVLTKTVNIVIGTPTTVTPMGALTITNPATGASATDGGTLTVPATTNTYTGTPVTVAWNAQNVASCEVIKISGQSFAAGGLSGSQTWAPKQSTTLQLRCFTDPDGSPVLTKTVSLVIASATTSTTDSTGTIAPVRITNASPIPAATAGTAYSHTFTSTGGSGTRTWSTTGTVPAGLSLNTAACANSVSCSFTGIPTTPGTYSFSVRLATGDGQSLTKPFSLTVGGQTVQDPIASTFGFLSSGNVVPTITVASGASVTVNWSTANAGSCAVYGHAPGSNTNLFYASGPSGNQQYTPTRATTVFDLKCYKDSALVLEKSATATLTAVPSTSTLFRITSTSPLPAATAGTPYSYTFTSTGGSGTHTWRVGTGSLPAGLSLNPAACTGSTCVLSGTPTAAGTSTFTLNMSSANQSIGKQFSITVGGSASVAATGNISVAASGGSPRAATDSTQTTISIQPGTQVSVAWSASGAQSCAVYGGTSFYATGLSDTKTHSPTRATTYRLECFKDGAQVISKSVVVNILASAEVMGSLDYNNDHKLDQTDVQFLLDVAVGTRTCPTGKRCDVNVDSRVTSSDALDLSKYMGTSSLGGRYDYNNDLKVDALDVARLSGVVAGTATCPTGKMCDLNGSGVTSSDVDLLRGYIGSPATQGSVLGANTGNTVCYTPATRDLTVGSTGADVTNLQEVLSYDGQNVPATGYFGKQTQSAVIKFQQKYSIQPASGYVGPLTRAKLTELYDCSLDEPTVEEARGGKKGGGSGGSGGGGVPTNYGYGYLTDGTYITFILKNGVYTVQTPTSLAGRIVTKNTNGTYTLK